MTYPTSPDGDSEARAMTATCPQCNGDGYFMQDRTRPACCGNVYPSGECRSHCAVPEYYQEQVGCDACGGTGELKELALPPEARPAP